MKKMILTAAMVIAAMGVKAQVMVNGVDITTTDVKYIQLVCTTKLLNLNEVTINVDYGQDIKWNSPRQVIKGPDGKNLSFESMVGALNFMDENGFEFVSREVITVGQQNVYHFLLKRRD